MNRMLEGLVAWVLNSYVGEYVENLNTEQLSIGLLQGEVELENLPLKKDALRSLDLPLEIKAGFIGKIKLQIPVRRLRSEAWVISMEKLYLVAGPLSNVKCDQEAERKADFERKRAQLKALEDKWKLSRQIQPTGTPSSSYWSYWGMDSLTSLATNILENLQLNVKDVHLRYEDNTTIPRCSFACGVVIKGLSAQSTDTSWVPKFVGRDDCDMMHKLVNLEGFNVYWDVDAMLVGHLSASDLSDALQREMGQSAKTGDFKEHEFLLEPVTMEAKMRRNTTPLALRGTDQPRIELDIKLDKIPLALSDAQYRGLVAWSKEFSRHDKARRYRRWRPSTTVSEKPSAWWHYAIESNLYFIRERNRRQSKAYMLQRAADNVQYVEAYTNYLTVGDYYMDSKLKAHMIKMEEELVYEELKILREIVMDCVETEQKMNETTKSSSPTSTVTTPVSPETEDPAQPALLQRWFPGWGGWGGGTATTATSTATTPTSATASPTSEQPATTAATTSVTSSMSASSSSSSVKPPVSGQTSHSPEVPATPVDSTTSKEIEQEIMDVLQDSANNTTLKRDTVFAIINFTLQNGTVRLFKDLSETTSPGQAVQRQTLLELECSTVKMQLESRLRVNGLKFGVSVGSLSLVDKITPNSILPTLVRPQVKERGGSQPRQPYGSLLGSSVRPASYLQPGALGAQAGQQAAADTTLFELIYEKKPHHSSADYRLEIKTKPLEIVYNASAIKTISEFFTVKSSSQSHSSSASHKGELELAVAAKTRYEQLKKQTQAELRQTIDQLLEGEDQIKAKRWEFNLDISAPQFILPEDFTDQNTTLVVFDLGRLQFHNTAAQIQEKAAKYDDENEDFVTPSSTPPGEADESNKQEDTPTVDDVFSEELSESALHDKIYDKYTLNLSELQVMVGRARDNWKHARNKGTSHMHMVDKFSISLQFERRLLYTSDPQWPKTTLSGTLPSLVLHVNEQKIHALRKCMTMLSGSGSPSAKPSQDKPSPGVARAGSMEDLSKSMYYSVYQNYSKSMISLPEAVDQQTKQAVAESRLILMQFSIHKVSLEINSRERSVAELQVSGVRASFTKRPYDTSIGFTIHSLLVVDALQTFGEDFELLVASHRNLCLDSRSGSIRGSGPSSPLSPQSPQSPRSPPEYEQSSQAQKSSLQNVTTAVSNALQSLVASTAGTLTVGNRSRPSMISPFSSLHLSRSGVSDEAIGGQGRGTLLHEGGAGTSDLEALIRVELDIIGPTCPTAVTADETLHIANIQFNSLDVVANQQTIVELLGFFRRINPPHKGRREDSYKGRHRKTDSSSDALESYSEGQHDRQTNDPEEQEKEEEQEEDRTVRYNTDTTTSRVEVNADFHRLNLLLMRAEESNGHMVGRKVATATLSKAKIQATIDGDTEVEGSLGGLQLLDLTTDGARHQKIFSVGFDSDLPTLTKLDLSQPPAMSTSEVFRTKHESLLFDPPVEKAFNFSLHQPESYSSGQLVPGQGPSLSTSDDLTSLTIRMASLCYTHSPGFLQDLSLCISEFKDYMSSVGSQLRDVATEVALEWVHRKPESASAALYGSNLSLDNVGGAGSSVRKQRFSSSTAVHFREDTFNDSLQDEAARREELDEDRGDKSGLQLKLDVVLQTPVIMLPRTPNSPEVLVAHLGHISMQNGTAHNAAAASLTGSESFRQQKQQQETTNGEDVFLAEQNDHQQTHNPDKIFLQIRDMNMYSMNLDKQKSLQQEASSSKGSTWVSPGGLKASMFNTPQPGGFIRTSYGVPILHDTTMEVTVEKYEPDETFINVTDDLNFNGHLLTPNTGMGGSERTQKESVTSSERRLLINGKVTTPLKVALSKAVYEQILQTLDNLTPTDEGMATAASPDAVETDHTATSLSDITEESESLSQSVSALKLDSLSVSTVGPKERTSSTSTGSSATAVDGGKTAHRERSIAVQADFEMHIFTIQMTGDLGDGEQGLVDLRLQDFQVCYTRSSDLWSKTLEVSLQSLVIEDLLQESNSEHRLLMVSYAPNADRRDMEDNHAPPEQEARPYLSSSCPTSMIEVPEPRMPASLPSSFHRENVFDVHRARTSVSSASRSTVKNKHDFPCTPPPSRQRSRRGSADTSADSALVHIRVHLIDKKCPVFASKYNNTHRFVEVDFNSLETTVNLQTWVVLLDFLGLGAKVHDPEQYTEDAQMLARSPSNQALHQSMAKEPDEVINTEVELQVNSLSLVLNKAEYELARANVSAFNSHLSLRDGNFAICGQLGSMSLADRSPHGRMFSERFVTTGPQALSFDIFKYGLPDPDLKNPYDVRVKMRMSSVRYVHTHRFLQETLAFCQHFQQLQDVLGRMRAASAGQKIQERAFRSARISMDIEAGAPILLFPHSSRSCDILVMDLGKLTVRNMFCQDGSPGTLSSRGRGESGQLIPLIGISRSDSMASDMTLTASQPVDEMSVSDASTFVSVSPPSMVPGSIASGDTESESASYQTPPVTSPEILLENMSMTSSVYGSFDSDWRSSELESMHSFGSIDAPSPQMASPTSSTVSPRRDSADAGLGPPLVAPSESTSSLGSYYSVLGSIPSPTSPSGQGESNKDTLLTSGCAIDAEEPIARPQTLPTIPSTAWQSTLLTHDSGSSGSPVYKCLLDVMSVELSEMDLFSGEWVTHEDYKKSVQHVVDDLKFPTYVVVRKGNALLKEKCRLDLHVERNLEGDISHAVPDFNIQGGLSSVHCSINIEQYKLLRGMLEHNFGEQLEEFQRPLMSNLQDPKIHTVLSGEVWKGMSIALDLDNVTVELLWRHASSTTSSNSDNPPSLACLEFIRSRLIFDSYSDQSKDIDLVSHAIKARDTRYQDAPANARPNVFTDILQASRDRTRPDALQMELHYRSTKSLTRFTVLLNNMRLMGVFDWLLTVQDFLFTNADNPFKKDEDKEGAASKTPTTSTYSVGRGIMTKRAPVVDKVETPLEMKLNVTDTELVVVENAAAWDTNAVILKSTAVLSLRPSCKERPLSCSLQSLEVFSCSLASEDETALSIIDPMTVTVELSSSPSVHKRSAAGPSGLLDAYGDDDKPPILEVSFSTLNLRLSYNDLKLFMSIVNSVPQQALQARNKAQPRNMRVDKFPANQIAKLEALGFSQSDCVQALEIANGQLDNAAAWLLENGTPESPKPANGQQGLQISGFEIRAGSICLCLIDDCQDADVPVAEISFNNVHIFQRIEPHREGEASFKLTGDYYNRTLSGWEPFLENWGCHVAWDQGLPDENKTTISVQAPDVLRLNITSVLLEQYKKIKVKWTEDYYKTDPDGTAAANHRRRVPFIPFAIRNDTGCTLFFATVTTTPTRVTPANQQSGLDSQFQVSQWRMVHPGDTMPFIIEEREKIRHKHTHELKVHQIVVKIDGWREVTPVSVDKVGTYFRIAAPELENTSATFVEQPPARIVFDVTLDGSARKVITVRSALILHNRLDHAIDIRLGDVVPQRGSKTGSSPSPLRLEAHRRMAVPVPLVLARIWVRPSNWALTYCNKPIQWSHVLRAGEMNNSMRYCSTPGGEAATYRFCVSVHRQNYPEEALMAAAGRGSVRQSTAVVQPGHVITLMAPVRVVNLLPVDLNYMLKGTDIMGTIKPGKTAALIAADLTQALELSLTLENFPRCKELVIPPGTVDYRVKIRLYDTLDRMLELLVNIKGGLGGSLKLSISAPYWLVNKSGLPLVFKQDSTRPEAAGQFEEHEIARSVTPLLFSYADKEAHYLCTMRLGKSSHSPGTVMQWCHKFSLERGIGVRQLHVVPCDSRPDWVYNIGIEVRQGRGRYHDTNIITFAPRFQLDNRSKYKLAFAQRHLARGQLGTDGHLSALPSCKLSFHWPRLDLDQLLCVRIIDDDHCHWSGGFRIDKIHSFHINMRTENNLCRFLRVDIVLQGATFFIVFTDADSMPPPYRIDNYADVPIMYFQTKVVEDRLRTYIKPRTSIPYAWDEPEQPPHITLSVPGGTSATYNMNVSADGDPLYYENFIYIAFSGTFKGMRTFFRCLPEAGRSSRQSYDAFLESQELVLDVIHGNRVVLKKKEAGKRSQLWRMTSTGMLQHEGSCVPRDPRKPQISAVTYVLDISDIALQPGRETTLLLRKPDERRRSTQTWKFTQDGRLCCGSGKINLCVQAKDGIFGLRDGMDAVLGPSIPLHQAHVDVPIEMAIQRQKSKPGSGLLAVKVIIDGPTRVLQITDIKQQKVVLRTGENKDWLFVDEACEKPALMEEGLTPHSKPKHVEDAQEISTDNKDRNLMVMLSLAGGVGLSLVNNISEELIYISLQSIHIDYSVTPAAQTLEVTVNNIQIDNQLFGTHRPVLLFITPPSKGKAAIAETIPAISLSLQKIPNSEWNAEIYKHLLVSVKKITVHIEERLLWKLLQFCGFNQTDPELERLDECSFDSQRALAAAEAAKFKRYYFGTLKINTSRMALSMHTTSELPGDLRAIKRAQGIPLVKFEDAKVELDPFIRVHPFETSAFLLESITLHYTEELKSQAAKILGSVDFLGNPLGLFNDVTEGISGLLKDGNVGGLLKNVTHGVSNSAAKVTGSLSDGIGVLMVDDEHERTRQKIREGHSGSSTNHLVAGIRGLGHGLVGGVTSILTQTYSGIKNEGMEGLITGFSRGVVGTVTKPVAGVLDLAAGAASAVRDTSRGSMRQLPPRVRRPRCCYGPGGLLPSYSEHHAHAQEFLFSLNSNNYEERFIAIEQLRFGREDSLRVLISSEQVYFLGRSDPTHDNIVLQVAYSELYHCRSIPYQRKHYIELTMKAEVERGMPVSAPKKRPLVRCDSESIALKVSQQISYAKTLFDEIRQTLTPCDKTNEEG